MILKFHRTILPSKLFDQFSIKYFPILDIKILMKGKKFIREKLFFSSDLTGKQRMVGLQIGSRSCQSRYSVQILFIS